MTDPFLNNNAQIERLRSDYNAHKTLIVAFDFDNTVYDFHNKGYTFPAVISLLQECNKLGFCLICFTSNTDTDLILSHCHKNNILVDYLNESPIKECSTVAKPYFNILLDDRAGLESAYNTLYTLVQEIKNG